jgi:hypothetical protein
MAVILGFIPRIHLFVDAGASGAMDNRHEALDHGWSEWVTLATGHI